MNRMTGTHRSRKLMNWQLTPVTLFLGVFFISPLLTMALFSLLEPGLYGGVEWTFYHWNYGRVLGWADGISEEFDPVYLYIFWRSLKLAFITVALCLLICYPVAFRVSRMSERWKQWFLFLITLPFFASLIVRLYAWVLILRPSGVLNDVLLALGLLDTPADLIYNESAVVVGMVYIMIPFMFLPLYASVEKLDNALLEASFDLGASRLQAFFLVVFPLTLPGIVGGSILVFIPSLGNFIVPEVLGGAKVLMIGSLVEQQFLSARNWPFGATLAMLIMFAVLCVLIVYVRRVLRDDDARTRLDVAGAT